MPRGRLSAPRAVRGASLGAGTVQRSKTSTTEATRRPWTKPRTRQKTRPLQIGSDSPASAHPARLHPAPPSGSCPCQLAPGSRDSRSHGLGGHLARCLTSTRADCTNLLSPPPPYDPTRALDACVVIPTSLSFFSVAPLVTVPVSCHLQCFSRVVDRIAGELLQQPCCVNPSA